ncbi:hypothetical protein [Hymenobacter caeli]
MSTYQHIAQRAARVPALPGAVCVAPAAYCSSRRRQQVPLGVPA